MKIISLAALVFCLFFTACDRSSSVEQKESSSSTPAVMSPAVDFTLPSTTGEQKSLKDYAGKTILLNFWATWCIPCVAEMASLDRLYKTYKDRNFVVVGINVDAAANDQGVKNFLTERGISFPVLRDPDMKIPPLYGVTGFPESYFIGPNGERLKFEDPETKIVEDKIMGDRPWDSSLYLNAIKELLKK